jgi:hypothetical protein
MLLLLAMTIAQLLTDCSRNLSTVPANMDTTQQRWLVQAVNKGLAEFVLDLPEHRRGESKTERIAAAVTKTITVTATQQGITFDPVWSSPDQMPYWGRTAVVGNDAARYNRLQGLNSLMRHHEGASGTTTLEIRHDAVQCGYFEDAVEGDVTLLWETGSTILRHGIPQWMEANDALAFQIGRPERWWVESLNGLSNGAAPLFLIRLWPQPDAVYSLHFQRRLWPTAITTAMLASTTELPITAAEEGDLVAYCEKPLIGSQLWLGSASKEDAVMRYNDAKGLRTALSNNRPHTQPGQVRTKRGY